MLALSFPRFVSTCRTASPSSDSVNAFLSTQAVKFVRFVLPRRYVKAYVRRGAIEFFQKEYHKAMETYRAGLALEPGNVECSQGLERTMVKMDEVR